MISGLAATIAMSTLALTEAPDQPAVPAAKVIQELSASISGTQRSKLMQAPTATDRRTWRRDPSERPGVMMLDLTEAQRRIVLRLLDTALSEEGMKTVAGIRKEQNLIGRDEPDLSENHYWLAVYGMPGRGKWAWRFGGHHVSVHVAYEDNMVASATPLFLGANAETTEDQWRGYEALSRRDALCRQVVRAMSDGQRARALLNTNAYPALYLSEPEAPVTNPSEGVKAGELSSEARNLLMQLANDYTAMLDPLHKSKVDAYLRKGLQDTTIAFQGGAEGEWFYFRMNAPGLLFEFSNSGRHIHSVMRSTADFGS